MGDGFGAESADPFVGDSEAADRLRLYFGPPGKGER
jgi:hypothetical protein